jgi:hypothetical protein
MNTMGSVSWIVPTIRQWFMVPTISLGAMFAKKVSFIFSPFFFCIKSVDLYLKLFCFTKASRAGHRQSSIKVKSIMFD